MLKAKCEEAEANSTSESGTFWEACSVNLEIFECTLINVKYKNTYTM